MKRTVGGSRYQQIAADVAGKIASGDYAPGDRIFARSALSVQYGVSPETARRAIALLADLGIVEVIKGSGCTVASREKAEAFRRRFNDFTSVSTLWQSFDDEIDTQIAGLQRLKETAGKLSEHLAHYQHTNPLQPLHMRVTEGCRYLGESIGTIKLWQNTGVTIVAIQSEGKMIISPGPYATLTAGEEIFFVGPEDSWQRLHHFLYNDMPTRKSGQSEDSDTIQQNI
ncbi:GntR family transcriptional regulator [Veillonella magna]|jgi:K+/H+ antiporter YhaU regulatory subunit KhtT|uniref:GntR family transcriptional regulator n=1 Tax=Veillonella magna TaxID=464322 RepID=UPI0023F1206C|nr:GntR family transcriptional regulator [Veillonella magna]MBD8976310.1 GntR family transcriptional regulator [Veillonella magna]